MPRDDGAGTSQHMRHPDACSQKAQETLRCQRQGPQQATQRRQGCEFGVSGALNRDRPLRRRWRRAPARGGRALVHTAVTAVATRVRAKRLGQIPLAELWPVNGADIQFRV